MNTSFFNIQRFFVANVIILASLVMTAHAESTKGTKEPKSASCSMDGGKSFSSGAVVQKDARWFKCVAVYANEGERSPFLPAYYGWVEVTKGENSFSLK